ncbi:MAG: FkbM family methyltransferase [Gammaproteobacteria bacterium]
MGGLGRKLLARALRRAVTPLLPPGWRLPLAYGLARLDGGVEPELRQLHRLGPNRGTALDVGANEGQFSCRLARLYDRVVAFEINDSLTAPLRAYAVGRNVEVHGVGLSDAEGSRTLYVPVKHGQALHGWASLRAGNLPDADSHLELPVTVRTLDSFGLEDVTFLKADVEGHEPQLLAGARETIGRCRPVVLIEVKAANRAAVAGFFRELGYAERRLEDLTGTPGSPENFLYLPG